MSSKYIYLGQDWATAELNTTGLGSIYLAGPNSETNDKSWRWDFIRKIQNIGLDLTFLIPETRSDICAENRFLWQNSTISAATAVVFWFPNGMVDTQSFVDFGIWCKSERVFLGGDGPEIQYLNWILHTEQKINAAKTIDQLAERVAHWIVG